MSNVDRLLREASPARRRRCRSAACNRDSTSRSMRDRDPEMPRISAAVGQHVSAPVVGSSVKKPKLPFMRLMLHVARGLARSTNRSSIRFPQADAQGSLMSDVGKLRLRTADLDEAIDAVSRIYCPHSVRVHGGNRGLSSELEVSHAGALRIVDLKYSARVDIEAADFEGLMLMMSCT